MVAFAIGEILLEADELKQRAQAARPETPDEVRLVFEVGDAVSFDGVELVLTHLPRTTLAILAKSAGKWVSHEELLRKSRNFKGELEADHNKPVRDDKSAIVAALKKAGAEKGLSPETVESLENLIGTQVRSYRLNMREDEILFR